MLTEEDGVFVGELALDAVTYVGEHYGDDAQVVAATVLLVVRDDAGVHVAQVSGERD